MKNFLLKTVFVLIGWLLLSGTINSQEFVDGNKSGVIRVKFNSTLQSNLKNLKTTKSGIETGIVAFDAVSDQISANNMKRVFRYSPKFEERHKEFGLDLWYEVTFDESLNPEEVAKQYGNLSEVAVASPVRKVNLIAEAAVSSVQQTGSVTSFNDPGLADQWHYDNDGSKEWAVEGADINLSKAWEIETGSSDVIVAIIDGGVEVDHPDLKDAMWVNEIELNGIEGIDDDGNGFVDDIHGYNFVDKTGKISTHYHGTHVAGTVGAVNNNGEGVAGVAGGNGTNAGVKMITCQIFTEEGGAGGFAEALIYAADMGAVIGQNAW